MKTIIFMRHGESQPLQGHGVDFDRELTDNGIHELADAGSACAQTGITPSLVLCSPSTRTRQTLDWMLKQVGGGEVIYPDSLYNTTAEVIINLVASQDDKHQSIMVIGHNPGISNATQGLVGENSPCPLPFVPSQLCVVELSIDTWSDLLNPLPHQKVSFVYKP